MQAPVGYVIHDGQAYMTNFMALLENPNLYNSLPHVIGSGLVTAAFFVMAISAYHLRKKGSAVHIEAFQRSLRMGAITRAYWHPDGCDIGEAADCMATRKSANEMGGEYRVGEQ